MAILWIIACVAVGAALYFLDEIRRTLRRIEELLEKQRDRP